jgi:hypothetical protein
MKEGEREREKESRMIYRDMREMKHTQNARANTCCRCRSGLLVFPLPFLLRFFPLLLLSQGLLLFLPRSRFLLS